jgi:hypothetical protein
MGQFIREAVNIILCDVVHDGIARVVLEKPLK